MNNIKLRRFTAYCLDLLLITLISAGLFQIKFLHPKAEEYDKAYTEYTEYMDKVNAADSDAKKEATLITYLSADLEEDEVDALEKDLNKIDNVSDVKFVSLEDIKEDEKDKLLLNVKAYLEENELTNAYIVTIDDDKKINDVIKKIKKIDNVNDATEYKDEDAEEIKAISDMNKEEKKAYLEKAGNLLRKVDYYGISYNLCWIIVIILYFTLFPYFNKGMTIGKRIVKLQMVRSDGKNKKVALWQYFVKAVSCPIFQTLSLSNCFTYIVLIITPLLFKGSTFAYITTFVNLAISFVCYADFFMMACRQDNQGISDKLAKVEMIDYVRDQKDN